MRSPWDDFGWLDGATAWIDEHVERTGEVELVLARAWSAVVRVPTATGEVWFKEVPPSEAFEPALTELLARRRPDCLPDVIATEGPRMLTRHVGRRLRAVLDSGGPAPAWEAILPLYAEVQIDFTAEVDAALALGTPDARPELLPAHYEELGRASTHAGLVRASAARLAGSLPPTVCHMEAHDGNIFLREGRPVFIDWAEAVVAHPFVGLLLPLRAATERAGYTPGSPEVARLRDAYLEPFARFRPLAELRERFADAYLLATVVRAHSWHRTLAPHPQPVHEQYGDPVSAWLEILGDVASGTTRLGDA
jgi:hypothetical protein